MSLLFGTRLAAEPLIGGKNQDYLKLAELYRLQRPYLEPSGTVICAICQQEPAIDVFFPCEHRCVCRTCLQKENICEEHVLMTKIAESGADEGSGIDFGHCNCPICGQIIKKMFSNERGRAAEDYWAWCYEVNPSLPQGFERRFRQAGEALKTVYIDGKEYSGNAEAVCSLQ